MAALFALGVMSLTWMAFIAALIALEKTVPWGRAVTWGTAAVLLALALTVVVAPHDVPGLVVPGLSQRHARDERDALMVPWQISGSYLEACNCEALVDVVVSARGRDAGAGGQRRGDRRARSIVETPPAQADGNGRQIPTTAPPLPYKRNAKVPYPAEPATPIVSTTRRS